MTNTTTTTMKLLGDVSLYAIKCDYFMWSEEKGEYKERLYWGIDKTMMNIIIMLEDINDARLRVFDSLTAVKKYIKTHNTGNNICMDNIKPVKISYNCEEYKWEAM